MRLPRHGDTVHFRIAGELVRGQDAAEAVSRVRTGRQREAIRYRAAPRHAVERRDLVNRPLAGFEEPDEVAVT